MGREILERPTPPGGQRIAYGTHPQQFGELRIPDDNGPFPLGIAIHGGFWRPTYGLEHMTHLCEALAEAGFATWNVEYRRITENDGDWKNTVADVLQGVRFARQLPVEIDWDHVILFGFSAGGQLALTAAAADLGFRLKHAISLGGVSDMRLAREMKLGNSVVDEFLNGTDPHEACPRERIPMETPVLLIHGTADETVPIAVAESYLAKAEAAGMDCELIRIQDGDHFSAIEPRLVTPLLAISSNS
jgi:dipeptidyl aminopeptidase/acylaminoacyl peptidase